MLGFFRRFEEGRPPWLGILISATLALGLVGCATSPGTAPKPPTPSDEAAAARAPDPFPVPRTAADFNTQLAAMGWTESSADQIPSMLPKPGATALASIIPNTELANPKLLDSVWARPEDHAVAEVFSSGVGVNIRPAQVDPKAFFSSFLRSNMADARVVELGSVQGLVVEPDSDKFGTNPGSVSFFLGDMDIVIGGMDRTSQDLLPIAKSMLGIG